MKYGISDAQLQEIINFIKEYPEVEEAVLFGSRALGTYKEASDVDIALKGERVTHSLAAKMKFNIEEDTYLPFFFDFIAYPLIDNEALKEHIDTKGIIIYRKGWRECKLGEVATRITSGGTPSTKVKEYYGGAIPWLNTKEINFCRIKDTEQKITKLGLINSSAKWIDAGSVIVAMYGATAGKVAYTEIDLTTNQACCNITLNENIVDSIFIYYYLSNSYSELENLACGAAQQNLNLRVISEFPLIVPDLTKQRAIASVLSCLDDKIDLLHRQNKTLEAMAEMLFRQWFVEEGDEEWEEATLADVITVKGGSTPSTKVPEFWNGSINWTSPKDLSNHNSVFIFNTERKITEKGLAQISSGLLPVGTVLLSSRAPIGYLVITNILVAINQGYIAMICDKCVSNYFMYIWCKINMEEIKNAGNGSVFQEISKSNFKKLEVKIPSRNILEQFDIMVLPIFEKIKFNQMQIRTLENLRDTLLPKLISGEVRVKYD